MVVFIVEAVICDEWSSLYNITSQEISVFVLTELLNYIGINNWQRRNSNIVIASEQLKQTRPLQIFSAIIKVTFL